ncbi:MAG: hypothetical protein HRT98_04245 [Mycoplasmatales bacterium]|nr:hypothetical protein [Mycoplasmatales bacterium]
MIFKKKIFLSIGTVALISTPIIMTISCGSRDKKTISRNSELSWDGFSHKPIEEDLSKVNRKITRKLKKPKGDMGWINKLEEQGFEKFFVNDEFVWNYDGIFQRSPRTILPNSDRVKDIKNLDAKLFGMQSLKEFVEQNKGVLNLSLIEGTEDDSTGTLGVQATMNFTNNKTVVAEYLVDGFAITKDIELNGDNFTSITSIINALNEKTNLDFEKKVAAMTPQDLKNELIDLYNQTYGGRLTVIGTYKGKTNAIALDRHEMLKKLIQAFGDVSNTERYDGTWIQLGMSIATHPGEVKVGNLVQLFSKYSNDLPTDADKNAVAGLLGNLPADVMNMFPDLLKLFSQVADGVKTMPMVEDWAKNTTDNTTGKTYEEKIKDLDHILVKWVLKTGSWKK